jgi:hypothetical protein
MIKPRVAIGIRRARDALVQHPHRNERIGCAADQSAQRRPAYRDRCHTRQLTKAGARTD